jgi:hypothetical protein
MAADIMPTSLTDFERGLLAAPEGGIGDALEAALARAKERR